MRNQNIGERNIGSYTRFHSDTTYLLVELLPLRFELGLVLAQLSEEGTHGLLRQVRGNAKEPSRCPWRERGAQSADLLQVAQAIRGLDFEPPRSFLHGAMKKTVEETSLTKGSE